ncbi:hypothetical protein O1611_g5237 [Lasiodiplodia mahajangana]|uniref:Uncharacterized protein n=1 Tax=Lasiodiplodia mahajangana TaxID=1108764 RepID=A0ACC2JLX0_9PEZI|nr:hypothetical protein O1611_g5237 [Lasiodiplodia mahajangana]
MGAIYSQANRVLIWLGPGNKKTDTAMNYLRIGCLPFRRSHCRHVGHSQIPTGNEMSVRLALHWRFRLITFRHNPRYEGLRDIFDRDWIKRLWTLQESLLAKDVICTGNYQCPYRIIRSRWLSFSLHRPLRATLVSRITRLGSSIGQKRCAYSPGEGTKKFSGATGIAKLVEDNNVMIVKGHLKADVTDVFTELTLEEVKETFKTREIGDVTDAMDGILRFFLALTGSAVNWLGPKWDSLKMWEAMLARFEGEGLKLACYDGILSGFGLVPADTRVGDSVALLAGFPMPLLLRRQHERFTIVGPSFLPIITSGRCPEIEHRPKPGSSKEETGMAAADAEKPCISGTGSD